MSEASEYGKFEWTSPQVHVGEYVLTYMNTRIRLFGDPWQFLNHVEYTDEQGELQGMHVTQEFMNTLFENQYPSQFDYYPDARTQNWWYKMMQKLIDQDINAMEHGRTP